MDHRPLMPGGVKSSSVPWMEQIFKPADVHATRQNKKNINQLELDDSSSTHTGSLVDPLGLSRKSGSCASCEYSETIHQKGTKDKHGNQVNLRPQKSRTVLHHGER